MAESKWYKNAVGVITQALNEAKEQGLDTTGTIKFVDSRYPFGPRKYHPYKMWLKARGELLSGQRGSPSEREKLRQWQEGEPIRG
jgi:hypothetical protein